MVAELEAGYVVLPGLDRVLDDLSWDSLEATHPQFGLHQLLERLGRSRAQVREWPALADRPSAGAARMRLVS